MQCTTFTITNNQSAAVDNGSLGMSLRTDALLAKNGYWLLVNVMGGWGTIGMVK